MEKEGMYMGEHPWIIAISREYGSGGRKIASILAEKYGFPMYDRSLIENLFEGKNTEEWKKYDEKPRKFTLSRTVNGYSNSMEENLAEEQFRYIKTLPERGENFIILGRCAEEVLKDQPNLITLFATADLENRINRIEEVRHLSRKDAEKAIKRHDASRKRYHDRYSSRKWGDVKNYDLSINTSRLGIEKSAEMIAHYFEERRSHESNDN